MADFEVKFQAEMDSIAVQMDEDKVVRANFGNVQIVTEYLGGELYAGSYEVTPDVEAQTLPTKQKVMADDVTVKAIPVYDVSNAAGGNTFYIASEV